MGCRNGTTFPHVYWVYENLLRSCVLETQQMPARHLHTGTIIKGLLAAHCCYKLIIHMHSCCPAKTIRA